jgi:hypothetical protein
MTPVDQLPELSALGCTWQRGGGSYWTTPQEKTPSEISQALLALGARFITITASQPAETAGVVRLDYHWDLDGKVFTFTFFARDKAIESIYEICEAANWIEREVHEYFAVEFIGRSCEPLFLREGQPAGVLLREEDE